MDDEAEGPRVKQRRLPKGFEFWVDPDRLRVRFVARLALRSLPSGHALGGDYGNRLIRLLGHETPRVLRSSFLHELGHYLVERSELGTRISEEDACDLFSWLPGILEDPRNAELRRFMDQARRV